MKTIKLVEFGENLVSRPIAKKVFAVAERNMFEITFDCEGVEFISSSFADELFAKGKNEFGKKFRIVNLDKKPLLVQIIKQSFITRDKFTVV